MATAADGPGDRIRQARLTRGMTQAELAGAVGVSRSAVAQWETDRAGQVRGNLGRVAAALGVAVGYLLDGADPLDSASAGDPTERALLRLYRSLGEADRQLLLRTAVRLSRTVTQSA